MLIDSHAHLTDSKFVNVEEVIDRATLSQVEKIITPVGNLEDAENAIKMAYEHSGLSKLRDYKIRISFIKL